MRATFRPEEAKGVRETYEFHVDGDVFHARVDDGTVETRQGPAWEPDLVVRADAKTFLAAAAGLIDRENLGPDDAIEVEGDKRVASRCLRIFGIPRPERLPVGARS
jgi:hypothetical protein